MKRRHRISKKKQPLLIECINIIYYSTYKEYDGQKDSVLKICTTDLSLIIVILNQ